MPLTPPSLCQLLVFFLGPDVLPFHHTYLEGLRAANVREPVFLTPIAAKAHQAANCPDRLVVDVATLHL
jgi:hypothetical protein